MSKQLTHRSSATPVELPRGDHTELVGYQVRRYEPEPPPEDAPPARRRLSRFDVLTMLIAVPLVAASWLFYPVSHVYALVAAAFTLTAAAIFLYGAVRSR